MRALPDDNLAYPVLILPSTGGSGSGFYLNGKTALYLVTARHVLYSEGGQSLRAPEITVVSYPKDPAEKGENRFRLELTTLQKDGNLRPHQDRDVAIVRIGARADDMLQRIFEGVIQLARSISGIVGVSLSAIKTFDKVLEGNDVFIFGYPTSLGLKNIPQIDYARPLLRKGIIAGRNETHRTLILDCPVYPGNSGGPAIEVEQKADGWHFAVIGVVTEFVPVVEEWRNTTHGYSNLEMGNSGYSVTIPMDDVLTLEQSFA